MWQSKNKSTAQPDINCMDSNHAECNDPIFKCFEYAYAAEKKKKEVPEFQEEYEKIAENCRKLSAQLLDQCNKKSEIDQILHESAGSSKYFRNIDEMKYPRLRLAIEHNHKGGKISEDTFIFVSSPKETIKEDIRNSSSMILL